MCRGEVELLAFICLLPFQHQLQFSTALSCPLIDGIKSYRMICIVIPFLNDKCYQVDLKVVLSKQIMETQPWTSPWFCFPCFDFSLIDSITCFGFPYLYLLLKLWYLILVYCVLKVYERCFNLSHTNTTSERKGFKWEHKGSTTKETHSKNRVWERTSYPWTPATTFGGADSSGSNGRRTT